RAALVAVALSSQLAYADDFFELQADPIGVLDDHIQLRFPEEMEFDAKGRSASLDYGTARFTMRAMPVALYDDVTLCAAAVRDRATGGAARASSEPLAVEPPLAGCAIVPPPPRHGDELLLAAYIASPDGADLISFYVDAGGLRDRAIWLTLARRI